MSMNLDELPDVSPTELDAAADELFESIHLAAPTNWQRSEALENENSAFKSNVAPWTDEELDAMTDDISEEDLKFGLATSTPEVRELLKSKDGEK